jgi:MFS family permease
MTDSSTERVGKQSGFTGARSALALLLLINLFNYLDRQVLAAVVPELRQSFFGENGGAETSLGGFLQWFQTSFGFKPQNALIGLLSMAFMVTYMITAPLFGRLAEKRSRWMLIGVGVILWSLASGATGLAGSFVVLLLTRCLVGVGEAAYGPIAPTVISDLYPARDRGRVLSWFYMAIPVGSALGYVLGEQVAHRFGWRWAFYSVVIPGVALGIWALMRRETPRGQSDLRQCLKPQSVRWRDYLVLARTPSYVLNTLGMCAMTFAIGGIGFWMVDYVKEYRGVGAGASTTFGLVLTVAGIAATLLGGIAGDRLRARFPGSYFLVSAAAMFAGFPLFLGVLYFPFPFAWVFVFLACFCLFFNTGPTNTILANVTHPAIRAQAFALNILFIHALGDVISPVIIGLVSDKYGMNRAFLIVGLMFVVSGVFWSLGARHLARDTALAVERFQPVAEKESPHHVGA